jgi:hypothetical protein
VISGNSYFWRRDYGLQPSFHKIDRQERPTICMAIVQDQQLKLPLDESSQFLIYDKLKKKIRIHEPTSVFPATILASGYLCLRATASEKVAGWCQVTRFPLNSAYLENRLLSTCVNKK